ncbi:MAG: sigma-54-dependent Fis family transcriptional regulator [Calditrichaeota bacterium]|nr:sigma-54-dependent Fis family transcriptional regulator [Calditrichota bacterium]
MTQDRKKKILIVDDDASHRLMLKATLSEEGYEIFEASDGDEAVRMVEEQFYDLIMLDLKMKKVDGLEALKEIKKISPAIPVLIMTAYASVKTAVEGLKMGAFDYMVKPLNMDEVKINIEKTLNYERLKIENKVLKERLNQEFDFSSIIGKSRKMREVFEVLAMAAPSNATILILGESGTGKELIANAVHQNSLRKDKPFVKINCAALAENLLESELFGHEKGAYTGAVSRRLGRFEQADGGTLFLDEIGDMSLATQSKILRVLQEGEFERLGGEKTLRVDVRIIAATNKNLEKEVEEGRFRKDLYFRLSVVPVHLPALRERKEDIPALAEHFLKKYAEKNQRLIRGFTPEALDLLMRYEWPGNVRELENTIERAVILSRDEMITAAVLPNNLKKDFDSQEKETVADALVGRSIKDVEKELILKTLEQTGHNITRAAEILGITRRGLQYKLKELGIK